MTAPLYNALKHYAAENNIRLHMPGHKGGRGFNAPEFMAIGSIDPTEVPGLDDLHVPVDVILEAQKLAAEAWGAEESLFLVNGATSGIHSLILAMGEDARILIPRNAHRSVLGGLIISGAQPVYFDCEIDPEMQVAISVDPMVVKKQVDGGFKLDGALLVSPTFYGTVSNIKEITAVLNAGDIPLMVDEAHGGHFTFHPDYPQSALAGGAGAVVNGLHKTLPVLTQAAIMHMAAGFPWADKVRTSHDILTTTSPSYPLMASLDLGRAIMIEQGYELLQIALLKSHQCCRAINEINGLRCRFHSSADKSGPAMHDPLKILVEIMDLNVDGMEMARLLRKKYRIQVEMASPNYVLAMFSPFNQESDWDDFARALSNLAAQVGTGIKSSRTWNGMPEIPPQAMTPRQAFLSKRKTVMIEESEGAVSVESAAAYPPGIPVLMPGEIITHEIIEYLMQIKKEGISIHGIRDPGRKTIDVVK